MQTEARDLWGSTRDEVHLTIRDISVHFVKGEECTVLKIFCDDDEVPFAELEVPRNRKDRDVMLNKKVSLEQVLKFVFTEETRDKISELFSESGTMSLTEILDMKMSCMDRFDVVTKFLPDDVNLGFSRWCALQVVHLWDCPDEVRRYLETGDESIREGLTRTVLLAMKAEKTNAGREAIAAAQYAVVGHNKRVASGFLACVSSMTAAQAASFESTGDRSYVLVMNTFDVDAGEAWRSVRRGMRDAQTRKMKRILIGEDGWVNMEKDK